MDSTNKNRDITATRNIFSEFVRGREDAVTPLAAAGSGTALPPQENSVSPSAALTYNLQLPVNYDTREMGIFEMCHDAAKTYINAMSYEYCCKLIDSLVNELNELFLTDLGPVDNPVKLGPTDDKPSESVKLILVGSSHAVRMAAAADELGIQHTVVQLPGYRITAAAIEAAAENLRDVIRTTEGKAMVVYQIFDNNAFFCAGEDGSKTLPARGEDDSRYHVIGRLEVADHGVIKNLVNISTPLLRAGGEQEKVIISPLPRYIIPCCGDEGHITNRGEDNFKEKMCSDLGDIKKSLKDLVFGKKIRNFKILDPLDLMYGSSGDGDERPKKGFWRSDPVHPTPAGYGNLVNGIIKSEINFNRSYTAGGGSNRQLTSKHIKRQRWVEQDDATAHRVYKDDFQLGRGRGRGGGVQRSRGSRGGRFTRGGPGPSKDFQQYSRFKPY
jgi:hypothetical protein